MRGLGIIVDPGMCNTFGIFCGDGSASTLPGVAAIPAPSAPAVPPGGYQAGNLTGDPQAIINSVIDPSAVQDQQSITNWFGGVNATNQAGTPAPMSGTGLALLAIGGIALLAFLKK